MIAAPLPRRCRERLPVLAFALATTRSRRRPVITLVRGVHVSAWPSRRFGGLVHPVALAKTARVHRLVPCHRPPSTCPPS